MSYSVLGPGFERGVLANVTVLQLSLACAAVGLRFSGKASPTATRPAMLARRDS